MAGVSLAEVQQAATAFVGDILQVPPMVSAIQIDGRRLHELAREGIEVERPPRPVTVHRLSIAATDEPHVFRIEVDCSSGTYVRSLAADIGTALGGGAHLRNLRRTAIGPFTLATAVPLEELSAEAVQPPAVAVAHLAHVTVVDDVAIAVGHGKVLPVETLGATGEGPWAVLSAAGALLAVYIAHRDDTAKPDLVIPR